MNWFKRPPPFFQVVHATQMPTPGAMVYGFESEMLVWRPVIGPGIGVRYQYTSIFPTPQWYQQQAATVLAGLGGTLHGQSVLQPLSNPYA